MRAVAIVIWLLLLGLPPRAGEVSVEMDGFALVADLRLAEGKSLAADGVVLLLHDRLGDKAAEPVSGLAARLAALGRNSLAINLSLARDRRAAPFSCAGEQDHRFEDALPELHAWVRWLEGQGASDISLAGFGLGATQVALYASKTTQKAVRRALLITPLTLSAERTAQRYQDRFKLPLAPLLTDIADKIASDDGGTLLEGVGFLDCDNAMVTARAFASYYRDHPWFNTPALVATIGLPTLVVAAEIDDVSPDLVAAMQEVPARDNLRLDVIEAADRKFDAAAGDQLAERLRLFIDDTRTR